MCGKPLAAADVLYTTDARPVCGACFANLDLAATTARSNKLGVIAAGGVAGLAPFVFSLSESSYSTVNGVVEHAVYRDWFAVVGGLIAVAFGAIGIIGALRAKKPTVIAGIAVVLLGGYQIARGFGVFWKPNASTPSTSISFEPTKAPADDDPATCSDGLACFKLAEKLEAPDPAKAIVGYARACDRKIVGGCHNAAMLLNRDGANKDPVRARALYQRECDLLPKNCVDIGELYWRGEGGAKDLPHAIAAFKTSCDANDPGGCEDLGVAYRDGIGVATDPKQAFELLAKACDLDTAKSHSGACDDAGVKLLKGVGVAVDAKRAAAYFQKACDREPKACHDLGVVTEHGDGVPKDVAAARGIYKRACDAGDADSCLALGIVMENATPPELADARAMYKLACDAKQAAACTNLGVMVAHGRGGAKDVAAGKALFKQGCDGGDQNGCDNLKARK
jgi:TPR repeat protein